MTAVVVYESLWGNTAAIARAIAKGIGPTARALYDGSSLGGRACRRRPVRRGAPVLAFSLPSDMTETASLPVRSRHHRGPTCRIHRCVHGSRPCRPGTVVQPSSSRASAGRRGRDRGDQQRVEASRLPAGGQGAEVPGDRQVRTASRGELGGRDDGARNRPPPWDRRQLRMRISGCRCRSSTGPGWPTRPRR